MAYVVLALLLALCPAAVADAQPPAPPKEGVSNVGATPWTGDFDGMVTRRRIRFLVPYSKTYYFVDRAVQRGLAYDITQIYARDLNGRLKTGNLRIDVTCVPVARDEMIPALLEGKGDVALGNLTITPERQKLIDFTNRTYANVSEVVVTGPGAEPLTTAEDLSGREVYVRKSSSFYESLQTLNAELARANKALVRIRPAPENLEVEDILEMVNAGLVRITIADSHIATFWKQIFPKLVVHQTVTIRTGGDIAWMIRKNRPLLMAELNGLIARVQKSGQSDELLAKYYKRAAWAKAATSKEELEKFERTVDFFRKYGEKYDVEYLLLMAQGYQESQLNQNARSPAGAVGVMQVTPATGRDMKVGDINQVEPNIHAGVKFLRAMMNEYYANEPMDRFNKGLFTFAAYHAGPDRIRGLRKLATERGLNPNVWFNNVELMAAEKIGRQTVTYVANIYKYYLAYQLVENERAEGQRARESIKPGN